MIRFDNISKRYPSGLEALKRVNFELEAGEMAFLDWTIRRRQKYLTEIVDADGKTLLWDLVN